MSMALLYYKFLAHRLFEGLKVEGSKKEAIKKEVYLKIHIIYSISCVLNIVNVIGNK